MPVSLTDPGMIGYDSLVEVETSPGVWFAMGLAGNITPPNESVDQVDVTHMKSPNRTKQFISGLRDPGEMSMSINYVPGNDTDNYVLAWRSAGDTRNTRITYPTGVKDTFPAFPLGFSPTLATADKATADLRLKVAGAVARS